MDKGILDGRSALVSVGAGVGLSGPSDRKVDVGRSHYQAVA